MSKYVIRIHRRPSFGDFVFEKDGKEVLSTTCYWDLKKKIRAGKYKWCRATKMSTKKDSKDKTKKRKGIWIPGVPFYQGIFIHEGDTTNYDTIDKWSDGCIILEYNDMERVWNSITPKSDYVVVEIEDGVDIRNFLSKKF